MERLLAAIAADPDDIENWHVYADWLSERGDPRGELISLELAIEAKTASTEAIERHGKLARDEDTLLSPRLVEQAHHLALELWRGFIREARVFGPPDDPPTPDVLAALYADPHACLLRTLDLGTRTNVFEGLVSSSVRNLYICTSDANEIALADGFPLLELLSFARADTGERPGQSGLEFLEHPRLTTLHGVCPALASGDFELPSLDTLTILRDPMALLGARGILTDPPPLLATLNIHWPTGDFIHALRSSRLCEQLRTLSLPVDSAIIDTLVGASAQLAHLDLHAHGFVDTLEEGDALIARLTAAFPRGEFGITSR